MSYNSRLITYLSVFLALSGILFLLPQEKTQTQTGVSYPGAVLASSASKTWVQTSLAGGVNSGPYTIPWGSTGGWTSYSSLTNMAINDAGAALIDPNQPAEFISSIYDQGNYRSYIGATFSSNGYGIAPDAYQTFSYIRGANSASAVSSAGWVGISASTCPLPYRYIQYRVTYPIVQKVGGFTVTEPIHQIHAAGQLQIIYGFVTDAQTKIGINDALVEVDGSKVNTSSDVGGNKPGGYSIPIGFITDGTANVKVSASGYSSVTKVYPMAADSSGCSQDITANISLTKISTGAPIPTSTDNKPDIKQVVLPKTFNQVGSSTTDLSKIADIKNVPDFTLEVTGKNKIKFKDTVDLSSSDATSVLTDLGTYVKADKTAVVEVDSKKAGFLNKRASIVMYNLDFPSTPQILVDGKVNPEVVSNIQYKNKTLSFDVAHFTKFEAVANSTTTSVTKTTNNTNLILGIGLLLLAISVPSVYFVIEKRRKKH